MKNNTILMAGLILSVLFLGYQVVDLKQKMNGLNVNQPQISIPSGFTLYGASSAGANNDGFWVYKDDEKKVYLFRYDSSTNKLVRVDGSLYDR